MLLTPELQIDLWDIIAPPTQSYANESDSRRTASVLKVLTTKFKSNRINFDADLVVYLKSLKNDTSTDKTKIILYLTKFCLKEKKRINKCEPEDYLVIFHISHTIEFRSKVYQTRIQLGNNSFY